MVYTPKLDWKDDPDKSTPILAADLKHIEQGIADGDLTNQSSAASVRAGQIFEPIGLSDTTKTYVNDTIVAGIDDSTTVAGKADADTVYTKTDADAKFPALTVSGAAQLETQRMMALRQFHRVLGLRKTQPCDVLVMGHSFVEGVSAGAYDSTMPSALRDALRNLYPTKGVAGGFGFIPNTGYFTPSDWPVVKTGAAQNINHGIGRRGYQMTASGQKAVLTAPIGTTGVDILYVTSGSSGVGYYKVDGGTSTPINCNAASTDNNVIQIRSLDSSTTHTVEIGWTSGGAVVISGFMTYAGDESKGIRVWNGGLGSSQSKDWTSTSAASAWFTQVSAVQPALVIICLMLNDFGGASYTPLTSAATKANLQNIISNIRAKCTIPPSFVLCKEYMRQDDTSNAIEPWDNYRAVADQIAAEDTGSPDGTSSVITYDLAQRFGEVPYPLSTNGLVSADSVHPNQTGYDHWGDSMAHYLARI